jgi:hypothetical protein
MHHAASQQLARACHERLRLAPTTERGSSGRGATQLAISIDKATGIGAGARARLAATRHRQGAASAPGRWVKQQWAYQL